MGSPEYQGQPTRSKPQRTHQPPISPTLAAGRDHMRDAPKSTQDKLNGGYLGSELSVGDNSHSQLANPVLLAQPMFRLTQAVIACRPVSQRGDCQDLSIQPPVRLPDDAEWAAETTDSHSRRDTSTTLKLQHARFAWRFDVIGDVDQTGPNTK